MSRTVTRGLTALALGGLTSLTLVHPAQAAQVACPPGTYPPSSVCFDNVVTINATVVVKGQSFTFTLSIPSGTFAANIQITIYVLSTPIKLATFTTDASGGFSGSVTIPGTLPAGQHHLEVQGVNKNGSPVTLTVPFVIKGSGSGSGSGLPFTGFELGAASLLGAGLLGAGTLAVVSGRKRKDGLNAA